MLASEKFRRKPHSIIENGLGAGRIPRSEWLPEERERRTREMLCRSLNLGTVVAFVGAGCSTAFGLPSWPELIHEVIDSLPRKVPDQRREQLKSYCEGQAERFMFVLEECQRLYDGTSENFLKHLATLIDRKVSEPDPNPLASLLRLPIGRFATTNYDDLLETHLRDKPDCANLSSFTQREEDTKELAHFVLAKKDPDARMVFHCHGSITNPKSIIATEAAYQGWYLNPHDAAARSFCQTV